MLFSWSFLGRHSRVDLLAKAPSNPDSCSYVFEARDGVFCVFESADDLQNASAGDRGKSFVHKMVHIIVVACMCRLLKYEKLNPHVFLLFLCVNRDV